MCRTLVLIDLLFGVESVIKLLAQYGESSKKTEKFKVLLYYLDQPHH